jgi:hypothetical protein
MAKKKRATPARPASLPPAEGGNQREDFADRGLCVQQPLVLLDVAVRNQVGR